MAEVLESSSDAGKLANFASLQEQHQQQQLQSTGKVRAAAPKPQYPPQFQSPIRPNINPTQIAARPPPPLLQRQPQSHADGQQQRVAPAPLRRIESKGDLIANQPRIPGGIQNQPIRPPPGQQPRPQSPANWMSSPNSPSQQPNRPPFPYGPPGQNLQVRPPFPRTPGQHPVTAPNQPPFRPPFSQQIRQSAPPATTIPKQNIQNQNMTQKSPISRSNSIIHNEDDDDVVIGRATTPQKQIQPPDLMNQSIYGSFDNRSTFQNDDISKKISSDDATKSKTHLISTSSENTTKEKQPENPQHPPDSPVTKLENQRKLSNFEIPKMQRMASRGSIFVARKEGENKQKETVSRPASPTDKRGMAPETPTKVTPAYDSIGGKKGMAPEAPAKVTPVYDGIGGKRGMAPEAPAKVTPVYDSIGVINQQATIDIKAASHRKMDSGKKINERPKSKISKGDNDSGVDESTQGNDRNGPESPGSPLKSPTKSGSSRPSSATPSNKSNKSRSTSRQRFLLKTPEPEPVKKVPMNKIQVGHAPSPNLKAIRSKIGSLENAAYKPGGGNVKIESKKIEIRAAPKIEAKNDKYMPKGGDKKIVSTKLQWNAKSKIGSLENAHHKPGGGDKKIETLKHEFKEKAKPKVGSKDNVKHAPGGGDVKIQTHKIEIKAQSKIGSLDNVKHKPGGGDKKIYDDKDYLKNVEHPVPVALTPPSQSPIPPAMTASSGADENLNQQQS